MKEQKTTLYHIFALVSYAAAVFLIAEGYYWGGIAFIGAGTCLMSSARKKDKSPEQHESVNR